MNPSLSRRFCLLSPPGPLADDILQSFLRAAVSLDCPTGECLVAPGLPRWEADRLLARLRAHGELSDAGWLAEARQAYVAALSGASTPSSAAADSPSPPSRERFAGGEGPREKAQRLGITALSDVELLALMLRTGTSERDVLGLAEDLLVEHDGLVGLAGMDVSALAQGRGLGQAKAGEIAAAFELARRLARAARRDRPRLSTPEEVAAILAPELSTLRQEQFYCLALDTRSRLLGEPRLLSRGDIDGTEAGPRLFYRAALAAGASSAIAVHNHPTGDPSPSAADLAVTKRLAAAGRTLDIPLVDHVVIGDGGRFSSLRREHPHLFAAV